MVYCFSFHLCNIMGCFHTTFQLYFLLLAVFRLLSTSTVDKQYTDSVPQSVAVQPDEQCDKISHSERVILAHTYLSEVLPATDSLVLAQCNVCQH